MTSRQNMELQQEQLCLVRVQNSKEQWIPCLWNSGFLTDVNCCSWFWGHSSKETLQGYSGFEGARTAYHLSCCYIRGSYYRGLPESARGTPSSRATGTKPKSTTATVLDSVTSQNPAITVCLSPPKHSQSLTPTPRLKFRGMYKDEENSCVNANSEVQKEFSCSATLSGWLFKSKEFHPVLHTN